MVVEARAVRQLYLVLRLLWPSYQSLRSVNPRYHDSFDYFLTQKADVVLAKRVQLFLLAKNFGLPVLS